jgi:hypothetical protein
MEILEVFSPCASTKITEKGKIFIMKSEQIKGGTKGTYLRQTLLQMRPFADGLLEEAQW